MLRTGEARATVGKTKPNRFVLGVSEPVLGVAVDAGFSRGGCHGRAAGQGADDGELLGDSRESATRIALPIPR